jgi:mannose-1-phosphate guanylyltransferase
VKAMILAGGLSTRLYPLTKQVPKPLVPVAGVPNAVHLIHYLQSFGYDEIAINVFYLADAILDALGDGSQFGVKLHYLHEPVLMGSAGALKPLESYFGNDTFVVVGCDDLTDLPLDKLVAFHHERSAIATIGLIERDEVDQYGVVVVDDRGKITGFQEKPAKGSERSRLVNTGIYVFSPEIFKRIPANEFYDFGKQVFPSLQEGGAPFYGFDARGAYWCDIGTPAEYRRASFDVVEGAFSIPGTRNRGVALTATIGRDVKIDDDVWVGENVQIGTSAIVSGPAVIGDGVSIGPGARIQRSILWEGATIGENAIVRDTIVGKDYFVEDGITLEGTVVANDPVQA